MQQVALMKFMNHNSGNLISKNAPDFHKIKTQVSGKKRNRF